jgi:hypothetical protein
VASAYGALINQCKRSWKIPTIFDDGYFKDAAERYLPLSSWAIGGPMGYDWAQS